MVTIRLLLLQASCPHTSNLSWKEDGAKGFFLGDLLSIYTLFQNKSGHFLQRYNIGSERDNYMMHRKITGRCSIKYHMVGIP